MIRIPLKPNYITELITHALRLDLYPTDKWNPNRFKLSPTNNTGIGIPLEKVAVFGFPYKDGGYGGQTRCLLPCLWGWSSSEVTTISCSLCIILQNLSFDIVDYLPCSCKIFCMKKKKKMYMYHVLCLQFLCNLLQMSI